MFLSTKMSEYMMIHPSHYGCIKSTILVGLRKMYIDSHCSNLGIGIKISDALIGLSVIDPNEGCCITRCTFLLTHIIPRALDKLKKPTKEYLRSDWRQKGQDEIYEITLCQYLDPKNELPINPSTRFLCVAHPAWEEKCLQIILKGRRCVLPLLGKQNILKRPHSADPI